MKLSKAFGWMALLSLSLLGTRQAVSQETGSERAAGKSQRSASAILRDFHRVRMPTMSSGNSKDAIARFKKAIADGCRKKADLALELFRAYPEHEQVPDLMSIRWAGMNNALHESARVLDEVSEVLLKDVSIELKRRAALASARAAYLLDDVPLKEKLACARAACRIAPEDERATLILIDIAKYCGASAKDLQGICKEALKRHGDSKWVAAKARGVLKAMSRLGKDVRLQFQDAMSDQAVDTRDWAGAPFVVMIWSSTYGKAGTELASVAKLRKAKRLRVIGIRNWKHQAGPLGMKKELLGIGCDWPQWYAYSKDRKPWSGPWATSETPLYYLVDEKGRIAGLSYRFRGMARLLEQRLEHRRSLRLRKKRI